MSIIGYRNSGKPHPRTNFSKEEDEKLLRLVQTYGSKNWHTIASKFDNRNARQVRERYFKYLSPDLDRGPWSQEEDNLLSKLYNEVGPKWKQIAISFPKRTDIAVKNRMNKLMRNLNKANKNSSSQESTVPTTPIPQHPVSKQVSIIETAQTFLDPKLDISIDTLFEEELGNNSEFSFKEFVF